MIKIEIYETDAEQLQAIAEENGIEIAEVVSAMIDHMLIICKEKERTQRARNKNRHVGRPTTQKDDIPKLFMDGYALYKKGSLNISQLARLARVSRPTVYKYIKIIEQQE